MNRNWLALTAVTLLLTAPAIRAADPPATSATSLDTTLAPKVPAGAAPATGVDSILAAKFAATAAALTPVTAHKRLRVAVYVGPGASDGRLVALDAIGKDPNIAAASISPQEIRDGKLANYDVLLQPGGSGSGQAKALGESGRDKIREFVRGGGGYVGICGGSYLASDDYPWSLGILNAKVLDKAHWARGHGPVDVAPTTKGREMLGANADHLEIIYWQGPILAPAHDAKLPDYVELAKFTDEVHRTGVPGGVMPGATAIAAAPFGQGRVVCFSPHPEKTPGQEPLLHHAIVWVSSAKQ